jgi:adenylate cyclase
VVETTRRLAAVAFADVAGWSRLIEKSDVETLRAWKALQADLIEPKIREHTGRLLEVAGDSVLVEFPSAVAAVSWALDLQRGIRDPAKKRDTVELAVRIGINVEDVIVDGDRLVGDGVNIAARIHQLASPGEIVVTSAVREYVVNKLPVVFSDLGMRELKNISRRVHLYRVERQDQAFETAAPERERRPALHDELLHDPLAERDIRTVLVVDVVEPERTAGTNGKGMAAHWRSLAEEIESSVLPMHGGQLVKTLGHGMLLDFPHVPTAVRAAFEIQRACHSVNAGMPAERQFLLRMGMQVGELIADDPGAPERGGNLATRLTTIAGPGEIVVSAGVRDNLTPILDADVEDLGECYLKQLQHPVRAYRVGPPGPRPVIEPGFAATDLRPTIAVIPFTARSSDPKHQVVGEVLADEVISALSRTAEMNVISRLSTTAFRGRDASVSEVSAHLNAGYVLSGGYRIARNDISLVAELADAKTGHVVWAQDIKGDVKGIVSGKDELIDRLVVGAATAIMARELQRAQSQPLPTLEGYTLLMGAITLMHRLSPRDFQRAHDMLKTLIDRAPRQAIPQAWLAKWHVLRVWQGWADEAKHDTELALDCTKRALDADPQCSLALAIDGFVHTNLLKQLDVALERYELALSVNPNDSLAHLLKGTLHAFRGEGKQAMKDSQHALRLSPLDPHRYFYDSLAATAALGAARYDRAIELAQRSLRANRTHASTLRALTIAQWQSGRHDDARKTVAELMKLEPNLTVSSYRKLHPAADYETGKIWASALESAGVPQGK